MTASSTTLAPTQPAATLAAGQGGKREFQSLVESEKFKAQLAAALPKHLTPDRFIRVLLTATLKQPLLLKCTQESMFKGILDCAAAGLEIDGRRAHLIPFKNSKAGGIYEAQLIIDYKGIAELVMRSGEVSSIHADIVCENDVFEFDRGQVSKHVINLKTDRGAMYAAYCIITMKHGGAPKCDVMTKRDIDRIRQRSRAANSGPWVTDFDEMAKKTVFRRASKWVPLSPEIRAVVEEGNDDEPVNVTPVPRLAQLIGADDLSTAAPTESSASTPETAVVAPAKTYTPAEREALLGEVHGLMLDHNVTEAKVMAYVREQKLAKEGQDEVGTLATEVLDGLRVVIPTLKAAKG